MFAMTCSTLGMLSRGKMNPDSIWVGSIVPSIAPIIATRCDDVRAEIRIPMESATRMNSPPSASSKSKLPRIGTPNTSRASSSTVSTLRNPMTMYGATLPTMICHGRRGDTSSASMVPISFSRVSESAVMSAAMMLSTRVISPGTKRFALSRVGLKRARASGTIRMAPTCCCCSSSYLWTTAVTKFCLAVPVLGSVASVMMRSCATPSDDRREPNRGSNSMATCAVSV